MAGGLRRVAIRFTRRRGGAGRGFVEVAHFYGPSGVRVFHARCERGVIAGFIERVNGDVARSRTGKTLYLEGPRAVGLLRRLVVLAGCRQCTASPSKVVEIAEAVASLGEFEAIFWYNKMIEEYEKRGFWGVCRVAKAFRVLHGID